MPVALEDEHFSMYQPKPIKREAGEPTAFRRAASFAYDGVHEMGSQLRRSFRSTRSHTITTAWHSVVKRKCEERTQEDEGDYGEPCQDHHHHHVCQTCLGLHYCW